VVELIEKVCPTCGIVYGLERAFYEYRKSGNAPNSHNSWYCPNGHNLVITKSDKTKLQECLDAERLARQRAEQRVAEWQDDAKKAREEAQHERNRANGYKGHATRITKRAKAGVCPCCNRHFTALERHMASKHPDFTPLEVAA
jgi:hypothetical protein